MSFVPRKDLYSNVNRGGGEMKWFLGACLMTLFALSGIAAAAPMPSGRDTAEYQVGGLREIEVLGTNIIFTVSGLEENGTDAYVILFQSTEPQHEK